MTFWANQITAVTRKRGSPPLRKEGLIVKGVLRDLFPFDTDLRAGGITEGMGGVRNGITPTSLSITKKEILGGNFDLSCLVFKKTALF